MNNNKRPKSQGSRNTPSKGSKKSFKPSSDKRSGAGKSNTGKDFKSSDSSFRKTSGRGTQNDRFKPKKFESSGPKSLSKSGESSEEGTSKSSYKSKRSFTKNKDFRNKIGQGDFKSNESSSKRTFGTEKKYSDKFSSSKGGERKFSKSSDGKKENRFSNSPKSSRFNSGEKPSFGRDKKSSDNFNSPKDGAKKFSKSLEGRKENRFSDSSKSSRFNSGEKPSLSRDKKSSDSFNSSKGEARKFSKSADGKKEDRFSNAKKGPRSNAGEKSFTRESKFSDKKSGKFSDSEKKSNKRTTFSDSEKHATHKTPDYNLKKPIKGKSKTDKESGDGKIRLNRFIANSGVCSRREADNLIELGEVSVNGVVITELGYKVNRTDQVRYSGRLLKSEKPVYVLLNKPKDFITTTDDPQERRTVMALVEKACNERIYPVGRLDRNTTGLLLLTNDGELADKLTHPSNKIKKVYQAELDKPISKEDFQSILDGLELEDGPVHVDELAIVSSDKKSLGLEIHEGRNRIVRRIFEHLGYEVVKLDRVMYAGLTKQDLPRGNWRYLTEKEVIRLKFHL